MPSNVHLIPIIGLKHNPLKDLQLCSWLMIVVKVIHTYILQDTSLSKIPSYIILENNRSSIMDIRIKYCILLAVVRPFIIWYYGEA